MSKLTQKQLYMYALRGQKCDYEIGTKYGRHYHSAVTQLIISYKNEWQKNHNFIPKPDRLDADKIIKEYFLENPSENIEYSIDHIN